MSEQESGLKSEQNYIIFMKYNCEKNWPLSNQIIWHEKWLGKYEHNIPM